MRRGVTIHDLTRQDTRCKENALKLAEAKLKSVSPYSQGRHYVVEKLPGELHNDYEKRTWRNRCHSDKDGKLFIPPMAFANSIKEAAAHLSISVPGKGKATFTKNFAAGVLVMDPVQLPVTKDTVEGNWLFVPSDGRRGGGSRVDKCFPIIREWEGKVTYYVLDDLITEEVFRRVLECSGQLIGIGTFRPKNWGYFGRFKVESVEWVPM